MPGHTNPTSLVSLGCPVRFWGIAGLRVNDAQAESNRITSCLPTIRELTRGGSSRNAKYNRFSGLRVEHPLDVRPTSCAESSAPHKGHFGGCSSALSSPKKTTSFVGTRMEADFPSAEKLQVRRSIAGGGPARKMLGFPLARGNRCHCPCYTKGSY